LAAFKGEDHKLTEYYFTNFDGGTPPGNISSFNKLSRKAKISKIIKELIEEDKKGPTEKISRTNRPIRISQKYRDYRNWRQKEK
jgi:hypothetical protein